MKIIFVSDYLPGLHPVWGGAEIHCLRIATLVRQAGIDVSFLVTPFEDKGQLKGGFKIFSLKTSSCPKDIVKSFFAIDVIAFWRIFRILRRQRPDIMHLFRFNDISLSIVFAARILGIPIIWEIPDAWCMCPNSWHVNRRDEICNFFQGKECIGCYPARNRLNAFIKKGLYSLRGKIFRYCLNKIDILVVYSEFFRQRMLAVGAVKNAHKIKVLPYPASEIEQTQDEEGDDILFVGWIYPHKGLHILLEALTEVRKEIPDVCLLVAETGVDVSYRQLLDLFIDKRNLQRHVQFLGKKDNQEIHALMRRCAVLCIPDQWPCPYSIVLNEAASYARPVVATKIGALSEMIEDGKSGILVSCQDSKAMAEALIMILKDKALARRLGIRAREKLLEDAHPVRIRESLLAWYTKVKKKDDQE